MEVHNISDTNIANVTFTEEETTQMLEIGFNVALKEGIRRHVLGGVTVPTTRVLVSGLSNNIQVWDVSTPELADNAYLSFFRFADDQLGYFGDGKFVKEPEFAQVYELALKGNPDACKTLMELVQGQENMTWTIAEVRI